MHPLITITKDSYRIFSGGEVHLNALPCFTNKTSASKIVCKDYSMNGFFALAQAVEIIKRNQAKYHITVVYPYLPYARQDRVFDPTSPFSLKTFTKLLNSLYVNKVYIWDAHSDVAPGLINNCVNIPQHELFAQCQVRSADLYISPDAGAYKKISKLPIASEVIALGSKIRNRTGNIIDTKIYGPIVAGKRCLIVDDICDGGRTFIELAKKLKESGASCVELYVTHGIFSNGFAELKESIDHIYTTNSFETQIPEDYVTRSNIEC